jgi:nickel-dependent lactate racemase
LLFCTIENGLNDILEMKDDYSGFMVFVGYSGTHRTTKEDEFKVMKGFEKIINIFEHHYIPRNNLAGLPVIKKLSVHKNPEEVLK